MSLNRYKKLCRLFLFSLSLIIIFSSCKKENDEAEDVLAKINDLEVTEAHFISAFKKYYYKSGQAFDPTFTNKSSLLESEFNTYVLAVYADEIGISQSSEAVNMREMIKRRVLNEEYLEKEVLSRVKVSDEEIEQMFLKFNTQLNASHIFASNFEKADSLYNVIKKGGSFEEIAKREFNHPKLAENGGNLGYFSVDEMDVAFERKAYELKIGEISQPVRTAQGYSIIKLNDRLTKPVLTEYEFASKKPQFVFFAKKQKEEIATREHLYSFIASLIINEKLAGALWKSISQNYSSFISKEEEFYDMMSRNEGELATSGTFGIGLKDFVAEIIYTPTENLNNVKDLDSFKNLITGISYRAYLFKKAKDTGLEKFEEINSSIDQTYYVFLARKAEEAIKSGIKISDRELAEVYSANPERYVKPLELDLSRIVLQNKSKAAKILTQLNEGVSFEEMVQAYTIKNEERLLEGRLGYEFVNAYGMLAPKLSALQVGDISEILVYQNGEYHIYKCLGRKEFRPLSFTEAKPAIERQLEQKKFKKVRSLVIEEVKERNMAFINTEKLKELTIQI